MASEKIGRLQNARRLPSRTQKKRKQDGKAAPVPYLGWARFYKTAAVIGVIAVMMPYVQFLFAWGAGRFSVPLSFAAGLTMAGMGYGIQLLLLGKSRAILNTAWDFSFESRRLRLPLLRVIPACVVSAAVAAAIGYLCQRAILYSLRNEITSVNEEVGAPLLIGGFVLSAVVGCILVPFRPHQLLSTRTLVECFGFFGFLFGIDTFWGGGVYSPVLTGCFLVYLFCLTIVMNQEAVIKPGFSSTTCVATHAIRRASLAAAIGFFLRSLLLSLPALGGVTLVVIPLRAFLSRGRFDKTFAFPFPGYPVLNAVFYVLSFLCLVALLLFYILNRTPEERAAFLSRLAAWWERVVDVILTKLGIRDSYPAGKGRFEPVPRNFTDTVSAAAATEATPLTYRMFAKKIRTLTDTDGRFCYAWRTLVSRLCTERRDINPAMTPLEMASILERTTTIPDIRRLTRVFLDVTYAEGHTAHATEEDVRAVMGILAERWK